MLTPKVNTACGKFPQRRITRDAVASEPRSIPTSYSGSPMVRTSVACVEKVGKKNKCAQNVQC